MDSLGQIEGEVEENFNNSFQKGQIWPTYILDTPQKHTSTPNHIVRRFLHQSTYKNPTKPMATTKLPDNPQINSEITRNKNYKKRKKLYFVACCRESTRLVGHLPQAGELPYNSRQNEFEIAMCLMLFCNL